MAFIAIEGADGTGKSTHTDLLVEWLRTQGRKVAHFSFPQYGKPSAYFLEKYLKGDYGALCWIAPYQASLFFALDRYDAAGAINAALAKGQVVVSSRFSGSNMGIQGSKITDSEERKAFFRQVYELEYDILGLPKPDLSVVLSLSAATADRLIAERSGGERKLHESSISQISAYIDAFEDLADTYREQFVRLRMEEGTRLRSIEENQSLLRNLVAPLLAKP